MTPYRILPEALVELDDASTWHEEQAKGLGLALAAEFRERLARQVLDQPEVNQLGDVQLAALLAEDDIGRLDIAVNEVPAEVVPARGWMTGRWELQIVGFQAHSINKKHQASAQNTRLDSLCRHFWCWLCHIRGGGALPDKGCL